MKIGSKRNSCIISGVNVLSLPFKYNEESTSCVYAKERLLAAIIRLIKSGIKRFYTDCSYGFPLWGGEIVCNLMNSNDIELYSVFPHDDQTYAYTEEWHDRFYKVHNKSNRVISIFLDYDDYGNRHFSQLSLPDDEKIVYENAADFMIERCGNIIFCGGNKVEMSKEENGGYILKKALENNLDITIVKV